LIFQPIKKNKKMSEKKKVLLYVYDLSQGMVKQFSQYFTGETFDGIWHTGNIEFKF
jgi:hypothetical protein